MLPDWLPKEPWEEFIAQRKRMKKPMSDYAIKLGIGKLTKFRDAGENVEELINEAIFRGWDTFWPSKKAANWWETDAGIIAKGREFGMEARNGETTYQFKDRLNKVIAAGGVEARAASRTYQADLLESVPVKVEPTIDRAVARMELQTALQACKPRVRH